MQKNKQNKDCVEATRLKLALNDTTQFARLVLPSCFTVRRELKSSKALMGLSLI